MEKRKSERHDQVETVKGKLFDVVNFKIRDISLEGINLICGFQPKLGSVYNINLRDEAGNQKNFRIKVLRAEAHPPEDQYLDLLSEGILFAIGATFENNDEAGDKYLQALIDKKNTFNGAFFLNRK